MKLQSTPPWASGPHEILKHGLSLLQDDSDSKRRIAMILIDNAVELMIKTYLGLPKRTTGLSITKKEYETISESFPSLLNAVETYAADKVRGIDLGEIEWYHRLRNQLYHQGNGLTVERTKVVVYAELAKLLFENLFGVPVGAVSEDNKARLLGEFLSAWLNLEKAIARKLGDANSTKSVFSSTRAIADLERLGILSDLELDELNGLRRIRSEVIHGAEGSEKFITNGVIIRITEFTEKLSYS